MIDQHIKLLNIDKIIVRYGIIYEKTWYLLSNKNVKILEYQKNLLNLQQKHYKKLFSRISQFLPSKIHVILEEFAPEDRRRLHGGLRRGERGGESEGGGRWEVVGTRCCSYNEEPSNLTLLRVVLSSRVPFSSEAPTVLSYHLPSCAVISDPIVHGVGLFRPGRGDRSLD